MSCGLEAMLVIGPQASGRLRVGLYNALLSMGTHQRGQAEFISVEGLIILAGWILSLAALMRPEGHWSACWSLTCFPSFFRKINVQVKQFGHSNMALNQTVHQHELKPSHFIRYSNRG